jgi:hypothetical protein
VDVLLRTAYEVVSILVFKNVAYAVRCAVTDSDRDISRTLQKVVQM